MEPREDMLPDAEGTETVKEDVKPPVTKDVKKEAKPQSVSVPPEEDPVVKTPEPKGNKTPETELYSALRKERKMRKEAEAKLKDNLEVSSAPEEDEDELTSLRSDVKELIEERELEKVVEKSPILADKHEEFEEFRESNPHLSPQEASVLFKAEEGVSDETPVGLEKPTSGPKKLSTSGYTPDQVEDIRIKEPRRYERMVQEGKFDKVDWGSPED